jgi:hypothetical protein
VQWHKVLGQLYPGESVREGGGHKLFRQNSCLVQDSMLLPWPYLDQQTGCTVTECHPSLSASPCCKPYDEA